MPRRSVVSLWFARLLLACLASAMAPRAGAGEPALPQAGPAIRQAPAADPFAVPRGTPLELLQYIGQLQMQRPEKMDYDAVLAFRLKLHRAVAEASARALAGKPTAEQADAALHYRAIALTALDRLNDPEAAK